MSQLQRKYDEHGFPIPPSYQEAFGTEERQRRRVPRRLRWGGLVVLAVAALGLLFGPPIWSAVKLRLAEHLKAQAVQKYRSGDSAGALTDLERSVALNPADGETTLLRGMLRLQEHDLEGSLADFDRVLEIPSPLTVNDDQIAEAYRQRSMVYQRMGRHREAISDSTRMVLMGTGNNPDALNHRAYARAIAAADPDSGISEQELEEGLKDIETALRIDGSDQPAFLDTRAYLLYFLKRYDEALADMDKAIKATEHQKNVLLMREDASQPRVVRTLEAIDQSLAVMYHHRGLIHKALGNSDEANDDLALGDKLGFNPAKGVY